MTCPIGLICEHFDCDREYCRFLARPWPLPYDSFALAPECQVINPELKVIMPEYRDTSDNPSEYQLEQIFRYNEWVQSVHHNFWYGGWWKSVDLPYKSHPDGGLIVTQYFPLEEEITFACCLHYYDNGDHRYIPCWESFLPAVPINGYQIVSSTPPVLTDKDFEDAVETDNSVILKNGFELLFLYHFPQFRKDECPYYSIDLGIELCDKTNSDELCIGCPDDEGWRVKRSI